MLAATGSGGEARMEISQLAAWQWRCRGDASADQDRNHRGSGRPLGRVGPVAR